jgi:hypothetical protein
MKEFKECPYNLGHYLRFFFTIFIMMLVSLGCLVCISAPFFRFTYTALVLSLISFAGLIAIAFGWFDIISSFRRKTTLQIHENSIKVIEDRGSVYEYNYPQDIVSYESSKKLNSVVIYLKNRSGKKFSISGDYYVDGENLMKTLINLAESADPKKSNQSQ